MYIGSWDADAGVATFDGTVPVGRSLEMAGFGPGSSPSPFCALVFARSPSFLPFRLKIKDNERDRVNAQRYCEYVSV